MDKMVMNGYTGLRMVMGGSHLNSKEKNVSEHLASLYIIYV